MGNDGERSGVVGVGMWELIGLVLCHSVWPYIRFKALCGYMYVGLEVYLVLDLVWGLVMYFWRLGLVERDNG